MRSSSGRAVLPPVEALASGQHQYYFTDAELHEVYLEVCRRRGWWRLWTGLRVAAIAGFLAWTFWLMPAMAFRAWPFN
jgi:hypothetical protein